ncbi:MAG: hypothetical protein NZ519_07170 [Bacteroidia bacterium]|nr:hypothetical protein [Bacteroidia bacterium]
MRDTEHAVRQCEAQRSTEANAQCAVARPERSEGTRPKVKLFFRLDASFHKSAIHNLHP